MYGLQNIVTFAQATFLFALISTIALCTWVLYDYLKNLCPIMGEKESDRWFN